MLHKSYKSKLLVALFAMLIGASSLNAQDVTKSDMMKKHHKMRSEMSGIDVMKADANGDGNVFACSMGCEVTDEAGRCSKCEMKLNEMSVADAESMLKEKGFNVVDHSAMKMGMKKDCKPGCDKPCCAKKEMADTKEYKPGCEKPCCAKKTGAVSDTKAFNVVCPVSGQEVSDSSPVVEYNGKSYGFCCAGCVEKFNATPEKYSNNLSEDGKQFVGGKM